MGIHGSSYFIRKHHLVERTVSRGMFIEEHRSKRALVDVCGSFFVILRQYCMANNHIGFARVMKKIFQDLPNTVFVMDGARSLQKAATHEQRDSESDRSLAQFRRRVEDLDPENRVSSTKWKELTKAAAKSYRISEIEKRQIAAALLQEGLNVIQAPFEADVEIARAQGGFVVISMDSDLLFHRQVKLVGRPRVVGQRIVSYDIVPRAHVLKRLQIHEGTSNTDSHHLNF